MIVRLSTSILLMESAKSAWSELFLGWLWIKIQKGGY